MSGLALTVPEEDMSTYRDYSLFEDILLGIGLDKKEAAKFRKVRFPFNLMKHQVEGIHAGLFYSRLGLFHEARCGKTAVMQALAIYFAKFDMKTIVLMPPALFYQFDVELKRISGHNLTTDTFTHSPKKRDQLLTAWKADHRTSPDLVVMSKPIFAKHHTALRTAGYQVLMVDESHMGLSKEKNKLYHAIRTFADTAEEGRLILSTGTPVPNNLYDVYPMVSLKSPRIYQSRRHFDSVHVVFKSMTVRTPRGDKQVNVPDHSGYMYLDTLHEAIKANSVRALKSEVLGTDAPNVQIVPVQLSGPHMRAYRQFMKDRVAEVDGEMIDGRVAQALRQIALQAISDPHKIINAGTIRDNAVLDATDALLESVGAYDKTKVVLFANYTNTVEMLERHYRAKYQPATIYGPNGTQKNQTELRRFQENGLCRLLIANPIAGGVGVTAGHVSQTAIFVEPVSTPGAFDQAASRVMLVGQTEPVSIYILRVDNTLSPKLIDLMMGKIRDLDLVMKDKKTVFDNLIGKA